MNDVNEVESLSAVNSEPLEMASKSPKGQRSDSTTSRFYEAETVDLDVQSFIETTSANVSNVKHKSPDNKIRQSRHLPLWIWYIIAKCNGIPLKPNSKPILGTILHSLTFTVAITYAISYSWIVVYDILSPNTPKDIAGGTISIMLVSFWCGFGFYCKDLSSRLFLHPRFLKDIRMHSRTVFKVNGAFLVLILGTFFTIANIVESLDWFTNGYCEKVELDDLVCKIMSVSSVFFCIFTLIWHSLVSFVYMSVCRTHTIGLRKFIKEIEYDASLIEHHLSFTHKIVPMNQDDIWQESLWIAEDEDDEDYSQYLSKNRHSMSVTKRDINPKMRASAPNIRNIDEQGEISVLFAPLSGHLAPADSRSTVSEMDFGHSLQDRNFLPVRRVLDGSRTVLGTNDDSAVTPHTMTNAELMHHFWKLNCRLRFSSCALQRWYASFVALVLLRCSTYLVHWLGHPASVFDILQFALPLVLLIVLSTSIAEVNFEGQRVLRCIYPSEHRIKPLQYMALNALQMSVYGFGMTHGTIVTVVFAMLIAFVSKIVITEISKT